MEATQIAQRMGQRVARAEPLLEGYGSHRGGDQHAGPPLQVGRVGHHPRKMLKDQPTSLHTDGLGHRVEGRRTDRLKIVGKGVEAGTDGDGPGHPHAQLGVGDHLRREHHRVKDYDLAPLGLVGGHPGAADL
jgi:hypothetical protein